MLIAASFLFSQFTRMVRVLFVPETGFLCHARAIETQEALSGEV